MRWSLLVTALFLSLPALSQAGLPDGSPNAPRTAECWTDEALKALQSNASMASKTKAVQSWINRCEFQWASAAPHVTALFRYAGRKYLLEQPYVKKLMIPLGDGRKLRGILAKKPGDKARDLVVFRCGVFCDADSNSTTFNALMNVFEENPVHVLFLNSTSGVEYAKDNGAAHLGGFDEGYQNLEAARFIQQRQGKLGIAIRRVHVMGMSLGANSTLFSSFYADAAPEFKSLNVGSFLALCPLVDTDSEFNEVLGYGGFASLVFNYRTKKFFKALPKLLNPLELAKGKGKSTGKVDINLALELSARFYEENWDRLGFAQYIDRPRSMSRDDLIHTSNLLNFDNRFSPNTYVLHARNDSLVPWKQNSAKLVGQQSGRLGVVSTKKGGHCAFTETMDWGFLTHYVSGIVNEGKDLPRAKRALPSTLEEFFADQRFFRGDVRSHYQWTVKAGAKNANLQVWTFDAGKCRTQKWNYSPEQNLRQCHSVKTVKIPLNELKGLGFAANAGDASSASRMERYLNIRTRILLPNGQRAVGSAETPKWLETQGKFDPRFGVL